MVRYMSRNTPMYANALQIAYLAYKPTHKPDDNHYHQKDQHDDVDGMHICKYMGFHV